MDDIRSLKKFIRKSIKNGRYDIDSNELQLILDEISDDNLQKFWSDFATTLAYANTERSIPHWKTTKQERFFSDQLDYLLFYHEKDADGKNVFNRKQFENHVTTRLIEHMKIEIHANEVGKNRPFFEKLQDYLMVFTLATAPLFVLSEFFPKSLFYTIGHISFYLLFCLYVAFSFIYYLGKKLTR